MMQSGASVSSEVDWSKLAATMDATALARVREILALEGYLRASEDPDPKEKIVPPSTCTGHPPSGCKDHPPSVPPSTCTTHPAPGNCAWLCKQVNHCK